MNGDQEEIGINFETGEVTRGEMVLMNLDEMLFLLDSANQYNNMFPVEQRQKFMTELRERIGLGFTADQYAEMKSMWENGEMGIVEE